MAAVASPLLLQPSWACKLSTPGVSFTNSYQEMTVKISQVHTLRLSCSMQGKALHYRSTGGGSSSHRAVVAAEYRRGGGGGGGGDFMAGFLLGGVVFGALGYLLAPQITRSISEEIEKQEGDEPPKKPTQFLEDDEGLEVGLYNHADPSTNTRKNLNEKIAQLNAAIDDVSAQLRSEDGFGIPNAGTAELESAA
ncbi:hypothetical protein CY35_17G053500 [Sphagnum magellanicum]|nr:hypothetical protein CY35_17G053500 [Sphagnum magellanicum]